MTGDGDGCESASAHENRGLCGARIRSNNALVVLLSGGIPERELDLLSVDLDIGNIVLENGRDVDLCVSGNPGRLGDMPSVDPGCAPLGTCPC